MSIRGRFSQWSRFQTILKVMGSHGFSGIIAETGFSIPLPASAKRTPEPGAIPRHLRLAFEELGPTFVKLGQLLSTRPDIFSEAYIEEFAKLTDDTPPFEFSKVLEILRDETLRKLRRTPPLSIQTPVQRWIDACCIFTHGAH